MVRRWIKVGRAAHYYNRLGVMSVQVERTIRPGDRLRVVGLTTDFEMTVERIEKNGKPVDKALTGDRIGLKTDRRAGSGDEVYKIVEKASPPADKEG